MSTKVVKKPWGKEIWMELNEHYCFKQIHINKGHRLSLQLHNVKTESMCVAWGRAKITLGNSTIELAPGDFIHVQPGTVHRITAINDLMIVETSTTEVDDVVRLQDDYNRIEDETE